MTCKADASRTLCTPIRATSGPPRGPRPLHPNAGDFFLPRDCSRSRDPPRGPRPSYPSTRKNGACWGPRPCPYGQLSSKARESSARLTAREALADHECVMSPAIFERERRSSRLFMRIRVLLAGKNQQGRRFRHACETIVVNAHGALLYFDQDLEIGSLLVLTNPFTQGLPKTSKSVESSTSATTLTKASAWPSNFSPRRRDSGASNSRTLTGSPLKPARFRRISPNSGVPPHPFFVRISFHAGYSALFARISL